MSFIKVIMPGPRPIKVLVYGVAKSGKTQFALTFPRPVIIDAENGSALFVGRPGLESLPTVATADLAEAERAVAEIAAEAGKSFDTLIVDSISKFYDALTWQGRQGRNGDLSRISTDQWDRIHSRLRHFTDQLAELPMHVVVTAHEVPVWESMTDTNGRVTQVQTKDRKIKADPLIKHWADVIIQMQADHTAVIKSMRGVELKSASPIATLTFDRLMKGYNKVASAPAEAAAQQPLTKGLFHDGN